MKILEIVKFNDNFAYVLDEVPKMAYREELVKDDVFGLQKMLIGENEAGMMDFLTYHNYLPLQAFAGREITVEMADGNTRTLKDVWWSEGATRWQEASGVKLVDFTHDTLDSLKKCYVFFGGTVRKDVLDSMLREFNREHPNYEVWDYWAFENEIRRGKKHE